MDEPECHNDTTRETGRGLEQVGVRHRVKATDRRVDPNDDGGSPNGLLFRDAPKVAGYDSESQQISCQKHDETGAGDQTDQDLHHLAVTFGKDVDQSQSLVVVDVLGQKDAVQKEREPQSNGDDGTIVEPESVAQVGIPEQGVGIHTGGNESDGDHPHREGSTSDEKIGRFPVKRRQGP